jgi:hypothetical protein
MNKKPLIKKVANVVLVLILGLVGLFTAYFQQVHAQGGGVVDPTSQSKRGRIFIPNKTPPLKEKTSSGGIKNPGFENGSDGSWIEYSALNYYPLIVDSTELPSGVTPHGGAYAVWLGGDESETAYITQTVAISADAPTLGYWAWISSQDTCQHDFGKIRINDKDVSVFSLCDQTNTKGWVKRTVDLSAYAGQEVALQFRAETDANGLNSNLFIDDVSLEHEYFTFLPYVYKSFNDFNYFDDFSNPASGWKIGNHPNLLYGYLDGEYQIVIKNIESSWFVTPDLVLPVNYRIDVDARGYALAAGQGSYGLVFGTKFGTNGTSYETYQFLVAPDRSFALVKRVMDGSESKLINWTYSDAINAATYNHLRVDRVGTLIRLYVNTVQVATVDDASFTGIGRDAGLIAYSYDIAAVDTRFDNFSAVWLP